MGVAALNGSVSRYAYLINKPHVLIKNGNGRNTVVSKKMFDKLYVALDSSLAALRTDCIEFELYDKYKPIEFYPQWYRLAMDSMLIFNIGGDDHFYTDNGEIAMSPRAIILRNKFGEIRYLELETFNKIYTTAGGNVK